MRVQNESIKLNLEKTSPEQKAPPRAQFNRVLYQAERKVRTETLDGLMRDIEETGEQLVEERTLLLLGRYKRLVKRFLEEAVKNGLAWTSEESYAQGRFRVHHLVKRVDERLLEMTEELLKSEEGHLRLLALVGEIKGLLVELYA